MTMVVTNFFSPWSSNLMTMRSSELESTVPKTEFLVLNLSSLVKISHVVVGSLLVRWYCVVMEVEGIRANYYHNNIAETWAREVAVSLDCGLGQLSVGVCSM